MVDLEQRLELSCCSGGARAYRRRRSGCDDGGATAARYPDVVFTRASTLGMLDADMDTQVHAAPSERDGSPGDGAIPTTYRFGAFELDPVARELRRDGQTIDLPLKSFACILHLVRNRERAVARDELMTAAWGHTHLTDDVLAQAIRQARFALGDTGDEQRVIKTLRGFGFRWVAPFDTATATPALTTTKQSSLRWIRLVAAVLAVLFVSADAMRSRDRTSSARLPLAPAGDSIALVLPISDAGNPDDAWIRLGLMDYIGNRLRAAGQPMVPADTVVAFLRGGKLVSNAAQLQALTASTHARVVIEASARRQDRHWIVSIRSVAGSEPPLSAVGENDDVLAAARDAADRLAVGLGHAPAPEAEEIAGAALLVQRINAAILAQKPEIARKLIDDAPATLRESPEIRQQQGRIDFYAHDIAHAQATFESLLSDASVQRDPTRHARALNGLAVVRIAHGDRAAAEPLMEQAAALLADRDVPDTLGTIWMNLGNLAQERGDLDIARDRMARARRIFESTGDIRNLAQLDGNMGAMEARRDHLAEAAHLFETAADLHATIGNVGGELTARSYLVQAKLLMLEATSAAASEPRLNELLTKTQNPELSARGKVALIDLLDATGHVQAAQSLLAEVVAQTDMSEDLQDIRMDVRVKQSEYALAEGDFLRAARFASNVVDELAADRGGFQDDGRGRAWLLLVRAKIADRHIDEASAALEAMTTWATHSKIASTRVYASTAAAEIAAATGRDDIALEHFEQALTQADASRAPERIRDVVGRYVAWLLKAPASDPDRAARALRVVEHVSDYADRDYDSALIQAQAYRVVGPPAAWRAAVEHARALAGERPLAQELAAER